MSIGEATDEMPQMSGALLMERVRDRIPARVSSQSWLVVGMFVFILAIGFFWFAKQGTPHWGIYGVTIGVVLGFKLILSLLPTQHWSPAPPDFRVAVVVPFYNEDPHILARNLASIDAQTRQPYAVYLIDDGSADSEAFAVAETWAASHSNVLVIYQDNAGKREAMAVAFRALADEVDAFICVDSDTVLDINAIEEAIAPLTDPRVSAVTGAVVALNPTKSLLSRLIDLRYVNAFLYERSAYSRLGSVMCICGSLAAWRASVIREHLDDFLGQTFLGQRCTYGDDRHLTNLSLLHGQVVLAHGAVARTAVPERIGHFVRQQIRWGKSFFRESLWALRNLRPNRIPWWIALVEFFQWIGFTAGLLATVLVLPLVTGTFHVTTYFAWIVLAGFARSVHVFSIQRNDLTRGQQFLSFLLTPVYGLIYLCVLLPLRVYSLFTLKQVQWGTRTQVEVSI